MESRPAERTNRVYCYVQYHIHVATYNGTRTGPFTTPRHYVLLILNAQIPIAESLELCTQFSAALH